MIKNNHDISDVRLNRLYSSITGIITMPYYFYEEVSRLLEMKVKELNLTKPVNLADLGCGNGFLLKKIAERSIRNISLYGFEQSEGLVMNARKNLGEQATIINHNFLYPIDEKFKDTFDLLVSTEVIEHISNYDYFFNNISALLKDSGTFFISFPNDTAFFPFNKFYGIIPLKGGKHFIHGEHPKKSPQPITTVFSFNEIQALLKNYGFVIEDVYGFESFPYFFDNLRALFNKTNLYSLHKFTWKLQSGVDKVIRTFSKKHYYRTIIAAKKIEK